MGIPVSRLFNAYVIADWSAAAKPRTGKDSVWIGVVKRDVRFKLAFEAHNPATRVEAEKLLRDLLADFQRRGERALIGFDFALGYPAGTASALKLARPDWSGLWDFLAANVVDKAGNVNNRFAVAAKMNRLMTDAPSPFWGCPANDAQRLLTTTKPAEHGAHLPPQQRRAEAAAQDRNGKAAAKTVWQVFGNGTVGSQAIVGMPAVKRLVADLGDKAAVWPFTTGWRALTPADLAASSAVIAEISPALAKAAPEPGEIADRAQVRAVAYHLAKLDEAGKLGALFAPSPAQAADAELVGVVEREEGWILGV